MPFPDDRVQRVLQNEPSSGSGPLLTRSVPAIEDRESKLASAPTVLAAIGAMGHELVNLDEPTIREAKTAALMRKLRTVDWRVR